MSYITPDDLAQREQMRDKWSEQGFAARARLARGGIDRGPLMPAAPVPPLALRRRDFTPVPMPSRFPTDEGYNDVAVNGLGALGDDSVAVIMDNLTKELKANAIKAAAINTGLAIAVNAVPVIGTAISIVMSVFQAIAGAALQRQGMQEISDFQTEMNALAGQWEARIAAAQQAAFDAEKPAAIKLAVSSSQLAGLGSWAEDILDSQIFREISNPLRIIKQITLEPILKPIQLASSVMEKIAPPGIDNLFVAVNKAADVVDTQTDRPILATDTAIDTATGIESLNDTRAAIAKARVQAVNEINGQGALAMNNINSPNFRTNLRTEIAKAIQNSVPFQTVINGMKAQGLSTPQIEAAVQQPPAGLSALPMAGAAGAALLLMSLSG